MSAPTTKTKKLDPSVTDLENFAKDIFGMELYPWQQKSMKGITGKGGRSKVCFLYTSPSSRVRTRTGMPSYC